MDIKIQLDKGSVSGMLDSVLERLRDFSSGWKLISPVIHGIVRENFLTGGRPKWVPRKQTHGKNDAKPLLVGGNLMAMATNPTLSSRPLSAQWIAHVGEKGVVHQFGSNANVRVRSSERIVKEAFGRIVTNPSKHTVKAHTRNLNIPARPYFCIPEGYGLEYQIRDAILRYIMGRDSV